jgi:DNA-binding winged helix-turn-helix (wHTH) protein
MQPPGHNAYEFGEFRFEPEEARLSRAGDTVNLEPRAIAVLGEMVTHPGHLLARDDLLDTVWGHRHVTPSTLNRIVTMLRQALGDEPTAPRYIETVPRMGLSLHCRSACSRRRCARADSGRRPVQPAAVARPGGIGSAALRANSTRWSRCCATRAC